MFEDKEHPDHPQHVEYEVGKGSPLGGEIGWDGSQVGGDGGADVLSHDHGRGTGKVNPALYRHDQRQSHSGTGGLDNDSEYGSHHQEEEGGKEAHTCEVLYEGKHLGVVLQVRHRTLQEVKSHKKEGKSEDEFAQRFISA